MHVELTGTQPPVWRRVDLASDLFLDRIHDVLQMVMGWQDYHLHQFASGGQAHDPKAENYVMPAGLAEGIVGIDERRVRLDEVLVGPGDRLFYEYDFGDSWSHTLDLEEVMDRSPGADPARCVGGEWACPPEDCGGIGGYAHLLQILADPSHPDHGELRRWAGADFDPAHFEPEQVNEALKNRGGLRSPAIDPDSLLGGLLAEISASPAIGTALDALAAPPPVVEPWQRHQVGGHYRWLLNRIGPGGVTLTAAGYLPPAVVRDAALALDLDKLWIGRANREGDTVPVLHLRESAQRLGLLRKANGRLVPSRAGQRVIDDPDFLWQHLVDVLPVAETARGPRAEGERQAGVLFLLGVATGLSKQARESLVAEGLTAAGWRDGEGEAINSRGAVHMMWATSIAFEYAGLLPSRHSWPERHEEAVPAAARVLARAALGG